MTRTYAQRDARAKAHDKLNRTADSVTVSYTRTDGLCATVVGFGASHAARVADADAQLPAGEWRRDAVSTPGSIYNDLQRAGSVPPGYEGRTVVVA